VASTRGLSLVLLSSLETHLCSPARRGECSVQLVDANASRMQTPAAPLRCVHEWIGRRGPRVNSRRSSPESPARSLDFWQSSPICSSILESGNLGIGDWCCEAPIETRTCLYEPMKRKHVRGSIESQRYVKREIHSRSYLMKLRKNYSFSIGENFFLLSLRSKPPVDASASH